MDLFYLCLQTGSTDGMRVSTLNVSCMAGPNKVLPCLGQESEYMGITGHCEHSVQTRRSAHCGIAPIGARGSNTRLRGALVFFSFSLLISGSSSFLAWLLFSLCFALRND